MKQELHYMKPLSNFFLILPFLFFTFSVLSQEKVQDKRGNKPPNIIFILTDDLGYGDLGILFQNQRERDGKPASKTPMMDRLAEEGILLNRHYAPAPVCAPSRASLMSGVHQGHAEVRDNQFDKALPNNHTLPSVLKQAGYATALVGKWGLQGREGEDPKTWEAYPNKRGFDAFFGYVRHGDGHNHYPAHEAKARPPMEFYNGEEEISEKLRGSYTTDLFTAAAKKWIIDQKEQDPDKPFFLELAYDTPHAGLQIAPTSYPEGGGLDGGIQWKGEPGNFINTADITIDDYFHPDYAEKDWPVAQKRFASMVRRLDNAVGDIIQLLHDLEINEETLVVFTSDNGPHIESYGYGEFAPTFFESYGDLDGIKRDTWEGGIRVPTFAWWPGQIPSGRSSDIPSGFHDWMPTFTDLAGIPAPARTDGVSLLPILKGEEGRENGVVYIEYAQNGRTPEFSDFHPTHRGKNRKQMQVIYVDGFKGIRTDIKSSKDDFHIYNTLDDPGETNNLAGSNDFFKDLQQKMKDRVLQIRRTNMSAPRPYDDTPIPGIELKEKLEEGLQYDVYEIATPWTPDVKTLKVEPKKSGVTEKLNLEVATRENDIVINYQGFIKVTETGEYTFRLKTNRGAVFRIHAATVIDADKDYDPGSPISSSIILEKGFHPIQLVYARGEKEKPALEIKWSGPSLSSRELTTFYRVK